MSGRALRVACRIVFLICGVVSLVNGVPYAMLQGIGLPYQSEWVIFVVALAVVSIFAIVVTLLRRAWIATLFHKDSDDDRLFSGPLRMLGLFALVFYFIAVFAYFAPHTWNLNAQILLALCPLYLVKMTFDPSAAMVFLLLAPMNAGLFGALGLLLGYLRMWIVAKKRAPATAV